MKHKFASKYTCKYPECREAAYYGGSEKRHPIHCVEHWTSDEVLHPDFKCKFYWCMWYAKYGPKKGLPLHCERHQQQDEILLIDRETCQFAGCILPPTFGPSLNKRVHCERHQCLNEIPCLRYRKNPKPAKTTCNGTQSGQTIHHNYRKRWTHVKFNRHPCCTPECGKAASWGPKNGAKLYCKKHRRATDVCLSAKNVCIYQGCNKSASYGRLCGKLIHCKKHRQPGETSVVNYPCQICGKNACYGPINEKAIRCAAHKVNGDVCKQKKSLCTQPGCTRTRTYGPKGGKALYCKKHKRDSDIQVGKILCEKCTNPARYGPENGARIRCFAHRQTTDIILVGYKCKECTATATYAPIFGRPAHCRKHKEINEWREYKPKCIIEDCTEKPNWTNRADNYPTHCATHAAEAPGTSSAPPQCAN